MQQRLEWLGSFHGFIHQQGGYEINGILWCSLPKDSGPSVWLDLGEPKLSIVRVHLYDLLILWPLSSNQLKEAQGLRVSKESLHS